MGAFARETRLSETTFVQTATDEGADYRNRIWMTTGELPFAGHPSLGTAVAVARARGESQARYVQETGAGLQPIDVTLDGDRGTASMLQGPARFKDEVDAAAALAALGLAVDDAGGLAPQVVTTGVDHLMVPVRREALARTRPAREALAALLSPLGAVCAYAVAWEGGEAFARSFFLDASGVTEDPATGSAAGPFMALVHAREGLEAIDVHQGVEMGRRSVLRCAIEGDQVRVGGDVVVLADGFVAL
jgi:trans-2,3-dihydro-3-hydroxyanthranilate isomerase